MTAVHPSSFMSRADARHQNLPGGFNGFFASSRHSETDPKAEAAFAGSELF
jgi:hypothetical protein